MCHHAQPKTAFNINALAVLNTNQSAYKPMKLTQRCSVKSHKEHTQANTAQKNMKLPSLSDTSAATVFLTDRATQNICQQSQHQP